MSFSQFIVACHLYLEVLLHNYVIVINLQLLGPATFIIIIADIKIILNEMVYIIL